MSVKARWHQAELVLDYELSFDADPEPKPQRVESAGVPIALRGDRAELSRALADTIGREGALAEQGVTCAIKDIHDTSCHACPLYREDGSPAALLCAIGREQERLCTEIAVTYHDGRGR
jgi:hypothetical protein